MGKMIGEKFSDLSRRMAVALFAVTMVAVLIVFSHHPLVTGLIVAIVCFMTAVGIWEFARFVTLKGLKPSIPLMMGIGICEVIAFFIAHQWIHSQELPVFVFALGIGLFFLNRFRRSEGALLHVAVEFFGVVYVAVPLSYMLAILYPIAPSSAADGRWWLVYLIALTKVTDIGAYFIGRIWGKRSLAPVLSPKKTIEGAIGGLVCTIGLSILMVYLGRLYAGSAFPLKLMDALWLGLLIGIFGQLGDLAESMLKRDALVKDSNRIPGIGGILDMIDSLIFTAPIVYFYLRWDALR